jgi:hypothetical protein
VRHVAKAGSLKALSELLTWRLERIAVLCAHTLHAQCEQQHSSGQHCNYELVLLSPSGY